MLTSIEREGLQHLVQGFALASRRAAAVSAGAHAIGKDDYRCRELLKEADADLVTAREALKREFGINVY
jgi:hypothetical protein